MIDFKEQSKTTLFMISNIFINYLYIYTHTHIRNAYETLSTFRLKKTYQKRENMSSTCTYLA